MTYTIEQESIWGCDPERGSHVTEWYIDTQDVGDVGWASRDFSGGGADGAN